MKRPNLFELGWGLNFLSLMWVALWLIVIEFFFLTTANITDVPFWPLYVLVAGIPVMFVGVLLIGVGAFKEWLR